MIEIRNIDKSFNGMKILDDISFKIEQGKIVSLLGKSGAGKTTLANIISLWDKPDSGKIILDGKDLLLLKEKERRVLKRYIQKIPQHPYESFDPHKSICTSLEEGALFLKLATKTNIREYIEEYIEIAKLDSKLLVKRPHELSGGELQRAAIARALSVKPRLLIADEITSALDPLTERGIIETMKNSLTSDISILFITHNREIGHYIANRELMLKDGRIIEN